MSKYTEIIRAGMVASAILTAACGGSPTGSGTSLSVGGTYNTAVTLGANSCGNVTVQTNLTTIFHTAGASTLTVSHAGINYPGTIHSDATFSTTPKVLSDPVSPLMITITGSFTTTAIAATVVVAKAGPSPCQYTVAWAGPKYGEPNVIP